MRLGINNSIWEIAGISLHESLDRINSLGFRYVDVLAYGSGDPRTLNQAERRKIAHKFKDLGLTSSGMVMLVPGNIASRDSHIHISDNDGKAHANWIIGRGVTRVPGYLQKVIEMGIDETCVRYNEPAVASLELGEIGQKVKDPDQYVRESLEYLSNNVPEITK